jgi:hypothetical protein
MEPVAATLPLNRIISNTFSVHYANISGILSQHYNFLNNFQDIVPSFRTDNNDFALFQDFFSRFLFEHETHKMHENRQKK